LAKPWLTTIFGFSSFLDGFLMDFDWKLETGISRFFSPPREGPNPLNLKGAWKQTIHSIASVRVRTRHIPSMFFKRYFFRADYFRISANRRPDFSANQ